MFQINESVGFTSVLMY